MGCLSSKPFKQNSLFGNANYTNHVVVSLNSTTYGLLKVDSDPIIDQFKETKTTTPFVFSKLEGSKIMKDLEEEEKPIAERNPNSLVLYQEVAINSPMNQRRFEGKENKQRQSSGGRLKGSRLQPLKQLTVSKSFRSKTTPVEIKTECFRFDLGVSVSKQSMVSPLFDPELVAFSEIDRDEEEEEKNKNMDSGSDFSLELFKKKNLPGGENAVIIYTTTLRGIRKTYEDSNAVRAVIESYGVRMIERDISMDLGFREELRRLMGKKEVRVPVMFVKGRLIGGAEEVVKMDEEGKLGVLFDGIPQAVEGCEECAGMRFVICMECNGSCKVLDEEEKEMVKCGECNENGLIQCLVCC